MGYLLARMKQDLFTNKLRYERFITRIALHVIGKPLRPFGKI